MIPNRKLIALAIVLACSLSASVARAFMSDQEAEKTHGHAGAHADAHGEAPHHLSVVLAGTHMDEAGHTAITVGVDYEYRLNELLGLGFVVERAFGNIDATTVLAVADIHIWNGLALQVGPGIEFIDGESFAVGRIGALYEIELGNGFTVAPQLHYDISHEDSLVFGLAFGRGF